ncbi:MAG: glycosyltransferase N-terminal domain-containing protein [Ignavibacteriaceae bacterium]|nr:glycosyltransferase N-terminal domain-containing protein [Ignavibacteriaceae bacterium]
MKKFWFVVYNAIAIPFLYTILNAIGLFNKKVKRGIVGRERIFEELILNAAALDKSKRLIWFHSSSLGEFEQAKPIIEELKKDSRINILVTFFSPSGYENSRKYPYADLISYIPFDTASNAKKFLTIVHPDLAIFMRYDYWPNLVWAMKDFNVPCFIVDATMKSNSPRSMFLAKSFHNDLFQNITKILTVSEADSNGFRVFGCTDEQLQVVGDTRFDRVYRKSITAKEKNLIKDNVIKDKKVFVAGSTWEMDEEVILPAFTTLAKYDNDIIFIIAPHEPTIIHLETLENEFAGKLKTIRFSSLNNYKDERVIIVDSIGILLTLYTYADAAFIGGSFRQGIHNVLEAAVYGLPVMFGPKIENSQEARHLLKLGGGILIQNKSDAYRQMRNLFSDKGYRDMKGRISHQYVQENLGATEKILKEIYKVLWNS